ncbi:MAG: TolC family protein [Bacteroidia bacterium]|nr:TolC family protein [Bacteroidia bacterium]MDW8057280.1 TolC family protein [Bacteroidia bacterium]
MRWGWLALCIAWAQDTIYLTLQEAEQRFLQKNLLLAAQKLQIDAERALVWAARLWPNPQLSIEQMDVFTRAEAPVPPFLNQPRINQIAATFTQTLLTAGKRLKGIALAEASVAIQEAAFAELLRQLRYDLRTTIYGLQRDQILLRLLEQQAELLRQLAQRYRRLSESALVPLPEYLRIENLYMQVQADLREVRTRWEAEQHSLRELLGVEGVPPIFWIDTTGFYRKEFPRIKSLDSLLVEVSQRGDVRLAAADVRLKGRALALEKAMAYPDIDVVVSFDRLGGYRPNQWGVGFGLPLPIFNRNQGRIAAARYAQQASELRYQQTVLTAQSEVTQAWRNALALRTQWEKTSFDLLERYERAEAAYRENLLSGRINFLTYIDFFESYRQLVSKITELFYLSHQIQNDLQYATGVAE